MEASSETTRDAEGRDAAAPGTARVSLLILCREEAHLLRECLRSVLDQTFPPWEAIVVDDASATGADVEALVSELDDARIRVVRNDRPRGRAGARNDGAVAATAARTVS